MTDRSRIHQVAQRRETAPRKWYGMAIGTPPSMLPALWTPLVALALLPAYPPLEWHGIAWVALAPLMMGLRSGREGSGHWFLAGWIFGWVFFGAQFFWLYRTLVELGGMSPSRFAFVFSVLVGSLSLLPAVVFSLVRLSHRRFGFAPELILPVLLALQDILLNSAPFGGVSWGSLAGPQSATLAARIVVPLLGGSGLVLAMGLLQGAWAWWGWTAWTNPAANRVGNPGGNRPGFKAGAVLLAALTIACAWPAGRPSLSPGSVAFPALLVPGSLSIAELDAQRNTPETLRYYLGRTLPGLSNGIGNGAPGLIVWPESAAGGPAERGKTLAELSRLGGLFNRDILLGSNARVKGRDRNSLYLVQGGNFAFSRYDKRQLLPFGEYVPAGFHWLFRSKVTSGSEDFAPGTRPPVIDWRGRKVGLAICFESVLPHHIRRAVRQGAEVLVVAANDAWLPPAAARQHLRLSALRGLEAGRDVLFVSNGGDTAHLRGGGAIARTGPGGPALKTRPALRRGTTLWVHWGYFPLGFILAGLLGAALFLRNREASCKKMKETHLDPHRDCIPANSLKK